MQKDTIGLDTEMGKKLTVVGRWARQGDEKRIFIIPKEYHGTIEKMKNPLKATFEEILD